MRSANSLERDVNAIIPSPSSLYGSSPSISFDDNLADDSALVETQPQTQPQYDLKTLDVSEQNYIGCLIPAMPYGDYFKLSKNRLSRMWYIGRHPANDLVIDGDKLSDFHCTLHWNGGIGKNCEVRITDTSSDGTWIDEIKLTRGSSSPIHSGNAISLGGMPNALPSFIYRDIEGQSIQNQHQFWAKYDVAHELGSGAFARVHKCISRASGIAYAVKIIERRKLRPQEKETTLERERREIWILKNLTQVSHRHIASFVEHFEEEDTFYIILELVNGDNLLKYLGNRGALPEEHVRRMAAQICDAVAYIHSRGITHRDLKLENIMVTCTDPPDCKLVDFGLAKSVGSGTFLHTICGTPAYLAPELKMEGQPARVYDNLVDSWSLGIIFHCMLTNYTPFSISTTLIPATPGGAETIDWGLLQAVNISQDGHDFLQNLLTPDPSYRKGVALMLDHPWISAFVTPCAGTSGTTGLSPTLGNSSLPPEGRQHRETTTTERKNQKRDAVAKLVYTERLLRRSARIAALASRTAKKNPRER